MGASANTITQRIAVEELATYPQSFREWKRIRPPYKASKEDYEQYRKILLKTVREDARVTALVPAYNEEACIGETIESLLAQTVPFYRIIVINDCSTDKTAEVAAAYSCKGVTVLTPPSNRGKSQAHNYGISHLETEFFLTVDADTILAPECLEYMLPHMLNPKVGIVCGYVLPRNITTFWERGRFIEYIVGQGLNKKAQHRVKSVLIAAGCCSLYRTELVKRVGGFSERTITEDLDLTWTIYEEGYQTHFEERARCYSMEPKNMSIYLKQLDRWNRGMFQNLKIHSAKGRGKLKILSVLYLVEALATPAVGAFLITFFPLRVFVQSLLFLILWDLLFSGAFVTLIKWEYWRKIWKYVPCYALIRPLNIFAYVRAFYKEYIRGERLTVWEKGH